MQIYVVRMFVQIFILPRSSVAQHGRMEFCSLGDILQMTVV